MRRILVENARRRRSLKHGGDLVRCDLDDLQLAAPEPVEDLLALDDALNRLAAIDPVKAELVKLRYFAGMTIEEAANTLGISSATAKRVLDLRPRLALSGDRRLLRGSGKFAFRMIRFGPGFRTARKKSLTCG